MEVQSIAIAAEFISIKISAYHSPKELAMKTETGTVWSPSGGNECKNNGKQDSNVLL